MQQGRRPWEGKDALILFDSRDENQPGGVRLAIGVNDTGDVIVAISTFPRL